MISTPRSHYPSMMIAYVISGLCWIVHVGSWPARAFSATACPTARFEGTPATYVGQNSSSIAVGDVSGDGRLDLVTANAGANTVSMLLGRGNGTFRSAVAFPVEGDRPQAVVVSDFNGDSQPDIATASIEPDHISNGLRVSGPGCLLCRYSLPDPMGG